MLAMPAEKLARAPRHETFKRKRPERTGGFNVDGTIKVHESAYTKRPLAHRKRDRRAQRRAARKQATS